MSDYVTPTITCGNFTKGKHYEVFREYPGVGSADRVRINDDSGLASLLSSACRPRDFVIKAASIA